MKQKVWKFSFLAVVALLLLCLGVYANRNSYENKTIWDIALFRMDKEQNIFSFDYSCPSRVFSPTTSVRIKYHYTTGFADPFLFVDGDWLYVFYENEIYEGDGYISAMRTKDLKHFEKLGEVLSEPFHLSFPYVFREDDTIYMIPETRSQSTVSLYKSVRFPYEWVKVRDLLTDGRYVDSSIHKSDGLYYLFTSLWRTENDGLLVFVSDSLKGTYSPVLSEPVTSDKSNLRMGGALCSIEGVWYRPAQNCANYYGENLNLYRVDSLSSTFYSESFYGSMIDKRWDWSRFGGHQFSTVIFKGERIVAMDGKIKDNWINNRTRKLFDFFANEQ